MAITVVTPSTSVLLTTTETLRNELSLSAGEDTLFLERIIRSASMAIQKYCSRNFGLQTVQETMAGNGSTTMMLALYPLVTLSAVRKSGEVVDPTLYFTENAAAGIIASTTCWDYTTTQDYRFDYTAGYSLPNDDVAEYTLPADLEEATIKQCVDLYQARGTRSNLVKEEVPQVWTGTYNPEFGISASGLSSTVMAMVEPYKKRLI
jgi:hypothetical protein